MNGPRPNRGHLATTDGLGMFPLYADESYDDIGTLEVFIGGVGASPVDLYGQVTQSIPRRHPMERNRWLPWTLRQELLQALAAHYEAADEDTFPPLPPIGVLALLNDVGPALGVECLPVIQMLLDDLHEQGLVGRIPAPTVNHAKGYMSRESAEAALKWNAPVILLPLTEKTR
jgi:hypothetical protein